MIQRLKTAGIPHGIELFDGRGKHLGQAGETDASTAKAAAVWTTARDDRTNAPVLVLHQLLPAGQEKPRISAEAEKRLHANLAGLLRTKAAENGAMEVRTL